MDKLTDFEEIIEEKLEEEVHEVEKEATEED